jgi:hypothetical protein
MVRFPDQPFIVSSWRAIDRTTLSRAMPSLAGVGLIVAVSFLSGFGARAARRRVASSPYVLPIIHLGLEPKPGPSLF